MCYGVLTARWFLTETVLYHTVFLIDGLKMVLSRQYSAQTQQLLQDKGLKCVCELCDCGRYHKHDGCTRNQHMHKVLKRPGLSESQTDYQATYRPFQDVHPRTLRKPLPKLRNPHPPPMDFRTVQRQEFITRKLEDGMTKSCKVEESYVPPEAKFEGRTVYTEDYIDRGLPDLVKLTRPQTVTKAPAAKFRDVTTNKEHYPPKVPVRQASFGEIPSFAGSILFPEERNKNDLRTWNQDVFKGKFAKRPPIITHQPTIKIGTEGDHDMSTEHRQAYKTPDKEGRQAPAQVRDSTMKVQKRAKFQSQTQNKSDFPGFQGKMPRPRKTITPPPATINLAMNNDRYLETTNNTLYKITWDPSKMAKTKSAKKEVPPYEKPEVKFADITRTKQDYQPKGPAKVTKVRPPTRIEPNQAKFASETAYNSAFKHYKVPYVRYGDFHEGNVYLKPVVKFHQDGSVTTGDYNGAPGGRPRELIMPQPQLELQQGKMADVTAYKDAFSRKNLPDCSFLQWMAEHKAKSTMKELTTRNQPGTVSALNQKLQTTVKG